MGQPAGQPRRPDHASTPWPRRSPRRSHPSSIPTFSPNGDGVGDTFPFAFNTNEAGFIQLTATQRGRCRGPQLPDRHRRPGPAASPGPVTTTPGTPWPTGRTTWPSPRATWPATSAAPQTRQVVVYTALKSVKSSHPYFYPQDADTLAKSSSLTFTLTKAANVTWTLAECRRQCRLHALRPRAPRGRHVRLRVERQAPGRRLRAARPLHVRGQSATDGSRPGPSGRTSTRRRSGSSPRTPTPGPRAPRSP